MSVSIEMMGLRIENARGFRRHVEEGLPCYAILQALNAGYVSAEGGMQRIEPFECIVHRPHMPRTLAALDDEHVFTTNFVFLNGENIEEMLDIYGIVPGRIYSPESGTGVSECFRMLLSEYIRPKQDDKGVAELLIRQLLIYISRPSPQKNGSNIVNARHYADISKLRLEIYTDCSQDWNVDEMARQLGISTTWLNVLYHEQFGVSPKQDILNARMERAKGRLAYTDMTLKEIAVSVGFSNEQYFNRIFSKCTGVSPGEYRKRYTVLVRKKNENQTNEN